MRLAEKELSKTSRGQRVKRERLLWPTIVTAKPKTARQKQNTSQQNRKLLGENKNLTAKPKTLRQKQNTSRQNQKPHGKTKAILLLL